MMETKRLLRFHEILVEVVAEIERSEDKFGNQDANPVMTEHISQAWSLPPSNAVKEVNDEMMALYPGKISHGNIVLEEFLEAMETTTTQELREELIQLACVAIKMVRALDSKI